MNHWATIGLIAALDKAGADLTIPSDSKFNFTEVSSDPLLARRLKNLNRAGAGFFDSLAKFYRTKQPAPDWPNLLRKCRESGPLYTEDTVTEFHNLLVTTLIAYAALLQNVYMVTQRICNAKQAYSTEKKERLKEEKRACKNHCDARQKFHVGQKHTSSAEEREEIEEQWLERDWQYQEERKQYRETDQLHEDARQHKEEQQYGQLRMELIHVSSVARLLTTILNSSALSSHLKFLESCSQLTSKILETESAQFAMENRIYSVALPHRWSKAKNNGEGDSGKCKDSGKDKDLGEVEDEGEEEEEEGEGEGEGNDIDDQEDEELPFKEQVEVEGLLPTILGWMKTFISHYVAKQILEHYCAKHLSNSNPSSEVQIKFITMKPQYRQIDL
jgi:hypothetical protein